MTDILEEILINARDVLSATQGLRYQHLSIIGKILTLKTLVNSKLVYKLLHYPTPDNKILSAINKLYYDYVWEGSHRIASKFMEQPVEKVGCNMLNIFNHEKALKFQWLSKTLQNVEDKAFWEIHLRESLLIPLEDF